MGGPATLGGNRPLPLVAHPGEAPTVARRAPRAADTRSRLRRSWRRTPGPGGRRLSGPGPRSGRPRLRRARLRRSRSARGLLRARSCGLGLTLLAPNLVDGPSRDFLGSPAIPPRLLRALLDVLVLSLSLRTGTAWHRFPPVLAVLTPLSW